MAVELVIKIATLPQAIVARLGTAPARYLLWLMEKALYEAYRDIRSGLALAAFIHPEPEQVQRHFSAIVNPSDRDWNIYLEAFGFAHYTNGDQTYHLVHPFVFNPTLPKERPYERPVRVSPTRSEPYLRVATPALATKHYRGCYSMRTSMMALMPSTRAARALTLSTASLSKLPT